MFCAKLMTLLCLCKYYFIIKEDFSFSLFQVNDKYVRVGGADKPATVLKD